MFARDSWDAERASWRAVIHLNIIRSVITIIKALQAELDGDPVLRPDTPDERRPNSPAMTESNTHDDPSSVLVSSSLLEKHARLKTRLPALKRAFHELQIRLGEGAYEEFEGDASKSTGEGRQSRSGGRTEFCVRRLQEALASAEEASRAQTDTPTEVLLGSLDDILAIWNDEESKVILKKRHVRLQEMVPASVLLVYLHPYLAHCCLNLCLNLTASSMTWAASCKGRTLRRITMSSDPDFGLSVSRSTE